MVSKRRLAWHIILRPNTVRIWLFVLFDGLPDDLDNAPTAVEGLTQALSLEIDPNWNIKVSRHFDNMHITLK